MELASLDPERGLTLFFRYWRDTRDLDIAIRRSFTLTQSQFEERFRRMTRRRYGALAIFADFTVAAVILVFLLVPLHLARRTWQKPKRRPRRKSGPMRSRRY
jgi:hypothetical protein